MNQRLFSLCTPCPDGFNFCGEFRSRDFRSAPFVLHAPSVEAAGEFLGSHRDRLAGVILVPGQHLSTGMMGTQLSVITYAPSLFPYLADFAGHQLRQLDQLVSNVENSTRLALEHERLSDDSRRAAEEFEQFRSSLQREIEERRAAERQLAESEEQLRLIISSTGEAIYGIDLDGNCTFANESCLSILGYEQIGDVLGRNMHNLIHYCTPEGAPMPIEECRVFKAFRDGVGVKCESEYFWRRDGTSFPVEYSSYPIRKNGTIVGGVVIWRDITERRRNEEERRHLEQQLLHAQKLESLGVLAGGIAHDFNNILTTIIGNADLALMRINRESPAVDNLQRIEQAASKAADLAKQMLAYSGKGKFIVENLDMNRLLEEMLHMLEVSISKKVLLRFNLTRPLPPVEGDATQIRQVIMNLVINASEAIGDRSGVIAVATGCTDSSGCLKDMWMGENLDDGLYVYLEITDNGCGMDSETQTRIFDPFFTTKFTGRGLGMAAVLGIVRGHRGAIRITSDPGKGTTFKILLPASGKPAELFDAAVEAEQWQGGGTVLLVDDEETVRAIGREMLKELGFSVLTANDGRQALEVFSAAPDISFVILDLTMPHMDGEQCFHELRRINPDIRVIMSSGYNEQEISGRFSRKDLAGFIQKPYKLSQLRETIRNLV